MSKTPHFIETNISLKERSYYKMGGVAHYFASPRNLQDILSTIAFANEHMLPIAVLGSGSNCVFSDETFDGVVIALDKMSAWHWETDEILFTEAGVTNTEVAEICALAKRSGASWMYRMPGQIGASVRMNARCYGGEMSQIVKEVLTIDQHGHLKYYDGKNILLGYKSTILMTKPEIVVGVRFYFPCEGTTEELLEHMHACENDRHAKQHFLYPSCGSTFKNNYDYGKPSGRIFDELGLKGTQRGEAEVSAYHGNFIWNKKSAKTLDMLELSAFMRMQAYEKLNVVLDLEVQPIGRFKHSVFEACGMKNLGPYVQIGDDYLTGLLSFHGADVSSCSADALSRSENVSSRGVIAEFTFPHTIFSAFFMHYYHNKISPLPQVCVEILQLQDFESAQKNPDTPFLRWTTKCNQDLHEIFTLIPKTAEDCNELWNYSVSEIFFAHPEQSNYVEFELTPDGHQLALQFDDVRKRTKGCGQFATNENLKFTKHFKKDYEFGGEFSFDQLKSVIAQQSLKLQCALSLGNNQYFLAPYWPNMTENHKADFHRPEKFLLVALLSHENKK